MIDIIIPVYNAYKTLDKTLMSIVLQSIKDKVKVYLIDDYSSKDYNYILDKFSNELNIKLLRLDKNLGSGLARQYGLDHSRSKYVLFLDADDLFYTNNSLEALYNKIDKNNDIVFSKVYFEILNVVDYSYEDLHGKIYRRKFLKDKNIRFNDLRFHEDNVFNSLVMINDPKTAYIEDITYVYCDNKESITSKNKKTKFDRMEIYIDSMDYVINLALKNNCKNELIVDYVYRKYYYLMRLYSCSDYDQCKKIKSWLSKYDFSDYLEKLDRNKIVEIAPII